MPGKSVSFSDDMSSPECVLSASVAMHATSVECMLLDAEHSIAEHSAGTAQKNDDINETAALRGGPAVDESDLQARMQQYVHSPPDARLMQWLQVCLSFSFVAAMPVGYARVL